MTDEQVQRHREDCAREVRQTIRGLSMIMNQLTPEQRKRAFDDLMDGYCRECGRPEPCHCCDDE